jgi:Domain of unknown function (DUF4388)
MHAVSEDRGNVVVIDAEGHLVVDPAAERKLSAHPGRFRVIPTAGEIVLLQRIDPEARNEGSASGLYGGRVALAGDIDAAGGLIDIIHFVHANNWSGQLSVVEGANRKTIHFRRGDIRTAASNVAEDRLGAILYRFGVVDESTLAAAIKSTSGAARLGQILVEKGALTAHELYTYVRKQVEEIFFSLLVLRKGSFYFYRTADEVGPSSQLKLSTKVLLFEGVRRIDELSYFRQKLPSPDIVLQRREPQPAEAETRLGPRELRVLGFVDGLRDIATIARLSHLGEFETTKALYQLLQAEFVQLRPAASALEVKAVAKGTSVDDLHARILDTFNAVYAKIWRAVDEKGKREQLVRGLDSFLASADEFAPLFVGVMLAADGRLPRDVLLANLQFAPTNNRVDYLHRGLSELLYFELFTAGEAVDRKEQQELHEKLDAILLEDAPDITIETGETGAA